MQDTSSRAFLPDFRGGGVYPLKNQEPFRLWWSKFMVHLRDLFCVEQIGAIKKIEFEENLQKQVRLFSELVYQTSCFYEFRNEANISSYFKIMYSLVRDFIKNWDSCGKEFFKKHNLELFSFVTNLLNRACIRQEIDLMEYHAKLKSLEVLFLNEMGKN